MLLLPVAQLAAGGAPVRYDQPGALVNRRRRWWWCCPRLRRRLTRTRPCSPCGCPERAGRRQRPGGARVILTAAPTPADAARLTRSQLRALLKRGERPRCGIEAEVERLRTVFRADYLRQLPQVEQALGQQTLALIRQVDAACLSVIQLATATEEAFLAHPGRSHVVVARTVKYQRLASAGHMWAFAASERRLHAPTTTDGELVENAIPRLSETCSTSCSAASTTACRTAWPTTPNGPSPHPLRLLPRTSGPRRCRRRPRSSQARQRRHGFAVCPLHR
ncbi:hypothetical protein EDD94_8057 [Streptomyces sp. PanSC9]|nr:hypothetical protein EDD94_8057 [Streptomyces sp. PanSC9]